MGLQWILWIRSTLTISIVFIYRMIPWKTLLWMVIWLYYYIYSEELIEIPSIQYIMSQKPNSLHSDKKCHYFPMQAREEFYNGKWKELYKNSLTQQLMVDRSPIYSYSPCITKHNLGNTLGNYFHEIFCAMETATNLYISQLVADNPHIPTEFNNKGRNHVRNGYDGGSHHHLLFFQLLPTSIDSDPVNFYRLTSPIDSLNYSTEFLVPKQSTASSKSDIIVTKIKEGESSMTGGYHKIKIPPDQRYSMSKESLESKCKCEKYCWSENSSPWFKYHETIRVIMRTALEYNMKTSIDLIHGTVLKDEYDMLIHAISYNNSINDENEIKSSFHMPVVPDIAIHYRCGDQVPSEIYGFLPFNSILSIIQHHYKNQDFQYVYILSDHPKRASLFSKEPPFTSNCPHILDALSKRIHSQYPNTTIAVLRGGDPVLDQVRLAFSPLTICSTSTFCLWPAIGNTNNVYFPLTPLIGTVSSKDSKTSPKDIVIPSFNGNDSDSVIVCNADQHDSSIPFFGSHYFWIKRPSSIFHFQAHTSSAEAIKILDS